MLQPETQPHEPLRGRHQPRIRHRKDVQTRRGGDLGIPFACGVRAAYIKIGVSAVCNGGLEKGWATKEKAMWLSWGIPFACVRACGCMIKLGFEHCIGAVYAGHWGKNRCQASLPQTRRCGGLGILFARGVLLRTRSAPAFYQSNRSMNASHSSYVPIKNTV